MYSTNFHSIISQRKDSLLYRMGLRINWNNTGKERAAEVRAVYDKVVSGGCGGHGDTAAVGIAGQNAVALE